MDHKKVVCLDFTLVALVFVASAHAQYLQVYPGRDANNNGTVPLYFGLMMSFGGDYTSSGGVPGVQVALDQINDDPTMLPGYTLHYILTDSQCDRTRALDSFYQQIFTEPTKIAWLGSGCSPATEPTAEVSQYYNITQVSCQSSSIELSDRKRFRYYFQLLVPEDVNALGFFGIIKRYEWRRVVILEQDENLFTVTTGRLKQLLIKAGIEYISMDFQSEDGIAGLRDEPFDVPEARIFILAMFEPHAQALLCKAYKSKKNIRYPRNVLITYAWYQPRWWTIDYGDECTAEQRESVLPFTLATLQFDFISDYGAVADSGINGTQFEEEYNRRIDESDLEFVSQLYGQDCYDAMWTLARVLNNTIAELKENDFLNERAGNASGIPLDEEFRMENFTYNNNVVAEVMFSHLNATNFIGITGQVVFNADGVREGNLLKIYQYREGEEGLEPVEIGEVIGEEENAILVYIEGESDATVWRGGRIPFDGVPIEEDVTVSVALTVIYGLLATAGIAFTITCLIFNFVFRERKLIRLSSPNLNYIIGLGVLVLYVDVYLSIVPTTDRDVVSALCNITPWLTSLGYSLIFGTILAKMARVYYIFNNPTSKKFSIQDWHLAMVVLVLVVIDLVILILYTLIELGRDNLSATRLENRENPVDVKGDREVEYEYYFYTCTSDARKITLGILYGYKGVLQVVSLLFAFQIRKVKVKGLNDARYIAAAIYVTSIILALIILSTYTLEDYINGYVAMFGLGLLVGNIAVIALVFVPKMVGLHNDPTGEKIFSKPDLTHNDGERKLSSSVETTGNSMESVSALKKKIIDLENRLSQNQSRSPSASQNSPPLKKLVQQSSKVSFSDHPVELVGCNPPSPKTNGKVSV